MPVVRSLGMGGVCSSPRNGRFRIDRRRKGRCGHLGVLHRPRQERPLGGRRSPQTTGASSQWHPCLHREFASWVFPTATFFAVPDLGLDRNLKRIASFARCQSCLIFFLVERTVYCETRLGFNVRLDLVFKFWLDNFQFARVAFRQVEASTT